VSYLWRWEIKPIRVSRGEGMNNRLQNRRPWPPGGGEWRDRKIQGCSRRENGPGPPHLKWNWFSLKRLD